MQTLCAGRSKVKPKKFRPTADPLSGGTGRPKFNQLEMVRHYLHLQTQFGENQCTQFRVIMTTDPHTNNARPPVANTQTGPITIHCTAKLSTQCKNGHAEPFRNLSCREGGKVTLLSEINTRTVENSHMF